MQLHFKLLTVKEQHKGNVISRKAGIPDHSIFDWFDDLGVYHQLILSGADMNWLSRMNVDIKNRNVGDQHAFQALSRAKETLTATNTKVPHNTIM